MTSGYFKLLYMHVENIYFSPKCPQTMVGVRGHVRKSRFLLRLPFFRVHKADCGETLIVQPWPMQSVNGIQDRRTKRTYLDTF